MCGNFVCQAVRNFFNRTGREAYDVLVSSTHDIAWSYGPFGENFGTYQVAFMGSTWNLESGQPMEEDTPTPLPNEPCVTIEWTLPMTESAQCMLFKRIMHQWNRSTASFPVPMKKKYRMSAEEIQKVRNLMVLADQLLPHLHARMSPDKAKQWENDIVSSTKRDADLMNLLTSRPPRFAVSMLASEQEFAMRDHIEAEERKVQEKEMQQAEVLAAQWSYFKGALQRDHGKLEQAQAAPRLVRHKLHGKTVSHRAKQAAQGEEACKGYQAGNLFLGLAQIDLVG